jgi:hypothetical protein
MVRNLAVNGACSLKGSMCVVKLNREIHSAKSVSKKLLRSVWNRISDKPFPDVYAFTLGEKEFLSNLELVQKNKRIMDTRVSEYGLRVPNQFIEALTFEFKGHLIIFVKQSVPLVDALEHELRHVASWNAQNKAP